MKFSSFGCLHLTSFFLFFLTWNEQGLALPQYYGRPFMNQDYPGDYGGPKPTGILVKPQYSGSYDMSPFQEDDDFATGQVQVGEMPYGYNSPYNAPIQSSYEMKPYNVPSRPGENSYGYGSPYNPPMQSSYGIGMNSYTSPSGLLGQNSFGYNPYNAPSSYEMGSYRPSSSFSAY